MLTGIIPDIQNGKNEIWAQIVPGSHLSTRVKSDTLYFLSCSMSVQNNIYALEENVLQCMGSCYYLSLLINANVFIGFPHFARILPFVVTVFTTHPTWFSSMCFSFAFFLHLCKFIISKFYVLVARFYLDSWAFGVDNTTWYVKNSCPVCLFSSYAYRQLYYTC